MSNQQNLSPLSLGRGRIVAAEFSDGKPYGFVEGCDSCYFTDNGCDEHTSAKPAGIYATILFDNPHATVGFRRVIVTEEFSDAT